MHEMDKLTPEAYSRMQYVLNEVADRLAAVGMDPIAQQIDAIRLEIRNAFYAQAGKPEG
jgi:hypothetical protein